MSDPTGRQIQREEEEFYGLEDLELEQRRAEYQEHLRDIQNEDLNEKSSNIDHYLDKHPTIELTYED